MVELVDWFGSLAGRLGLLVLGGSKAGWQVEEKLGWLAVKRNVWLSGKRKKTRLTGWLVVGRKLG